MKNYKIILALLIVPLLFIISFPSKTEAKATKAKSYFKKSSYKYVAPHYRTSKDSVKFNNYSAKGNYNPYTGKKGNKKW